MNIVLIIIGWMVVIGIFLMLYKNVKPFIIIDKEGILFLQNLVKSSLLYNPIVTLCYPKQDNWHLVSILIDDNKVPIVVTRQFSSKDDITTSFLIETAKIIMKIENRSPILSMNDLYNNILEKFNDHYSGLMSSLGRYSFYTKHYHIGPFLHEPIEELLDVIKANDMYFNFNITQQ